MNVSLNWLSDYVDISMPVKALGELLTHIGMPLESMTETPTDIVLELENRADRPDLLGHIGVAREIAAATGAKLKLPELGKANASTTAGEVEDLTAVEVVDPQLCPRYTARVLRGVKVGPSPAWMVERLEAMGLRGINNIVDATNYVMFEYSQPLHSFDYDKLAENRIVVRPAASGETLLSIDQTKCELDVSMLVIADADKPVAIAGVMGGLDTEVTEQTTNVLIESAQFDPLSVRRTSRKLALMSESNYRFERGVDPVAVEAASLRACELILELAGGELAEGVVDVWAKPYEPPKVTVRPSRTSAVLGLDISPSRQTEILERLDLEPVDSGGKIVCTVPPHRADIRREIDLVEEIARLEGYDKIPLGSHVSHSITSEGLIERTRRSIGQLLAASGFNESITVSFVEKAEAELFGFDETVDVDILTRKTNNALRPTILPNLLRAAKTNQDAGNGDVRFFEIASVFGSGQAHSLPTEHVELALLSGDELRDVRGALEATSGRICPPCRVTVRPAQIPGLADGQAGNLLIDGEQAGLIGRISPKVQDYYGLERPVAVAALRFDALLSRAGKTRQYEPPAKTPPVQRDLSILVDEKATWAELIDVIDGVDQPLRTTTEYVTTYRGEQIPPGRKSVTITLRYHRLDATLRGEEVDEQVAQIVKALKKKLNAELRH